jgi:hypothetical protein
LWPSARPRQQRNSQLRALAEESLALLRKLGVQWAIGFALNNLALASYLAGNLPGAHMRAEESLSVFRELQADASRAEVLITLGQIARAQRDTAAARAALTEALQLALALGPRLLVAAALEGLRELAAQSHQAERAAQLLAAAAALRALMGTPLRPSDQRGVNAALQEAQAALGAKAFASAWAAGQRPLEQLLGTLLPNH